MRVIVCLGIFDDDAEHAPLISSLLDHAVRGRHDVLVHPAATVQWHAWLAQRDGVYRDMYLRAERDSQTRQARAPSDAEIWIASVPASDWHATPPRLRLDDAVDLLSMPLEVLVEDETSDGAFLDATVPPPLRRAWDHARKVRRLRFLSLGGVAQVKRRLEGERGQPPSSKRTMVLIDSDSPRPWLDAHGSPESCWERLEAKNRDAARAAKRRGVAVHVLERRMAENYLPPRTILNWAQELPRTARSRKVLHAQYFAALPPERRRHHHLKDGLKPSERGYYGELSQEAEQALGHALGSSMWQAFHYVHESDLRHDGVHAELTPLFQRILGTL